MFGGAAIASLEVLALMAVITSAVAGEPAPRGGTLYEGAYGAGSSRGRLDMAVRFDAPVRAVRPGEAPIDPVMAFVPPAPTLSVGLPERKVALQWKTAPSRLFLNRGLGIRLDGDDRLTMRLRKGSLGLFMQTAF